MQWWLAALKNYAGFSGRARRTEYWMFALINFIIGAVLIALSFVPKIGVLFIVLAVLFYLGTILPGIAVAVRRMHDQDKHGAWVLVGLIPFGIGAIWLLVLLCLPGTAGPNQYGPDPKDPNALPWQGPAAGPAWPGYPPVQQPYPQDQGYSPYPQGQPPYPQGQAFPQQGQPPYPQGQAFPQQGQPPYPQGQAFPQQGQPPYPGQ